MDERDLGRLREIAAARVAGEGPGLLTAATEEARRRVHDELVEIIAEALRAQVLGPTPGEQVQEAERARDPEDRPEAGDEPVGGRAGTGWYVYCVIAAKTPLTGEEPGIDPAHTVTTIEHGDLAAVVSRVSLSEFGETPLRERLSDMDWLERTVRAHERVVEAVARQTTAIPMRLCSVYRRRDGVRTMLSSEGRLLQEALERLSDAAEWGVKGFAGPMPAAVAATASEGATEGAEGTAYMQERLQSRQRRTEADDARQQACAGVHESLAAIAVEARVNPVQRQELSGRQEPMVLNTAYLVRDEDAAAFRAELERSIRDVAALGLELDLTGPWPPYNFVPETIGGTR